MKLDFLFFGAHPDDVELGCGGTVNKLVKKGYKVGIVDLTRGELGTRGTAEIRAQEAKDAAEILGVSVRDNCDITDGHIEINRENKIRVIEKIRTYQPEIAILPYWSDRHPDHGNASKLIRECIYYSGTEKWPVKTPTTSLPAHRPKAYFYYMLADPFEPNLIVDVTNEFDARLKAFQAFKSQFHVPGHQSNEKETWISKPEFAESLIGRLSFYGYQIGVRYAEPFFADRPLKIDDFMMFAK